MRSSAIQAPKSGRIAHEEHRVTVNVQSAPDAEAERDTSTAIDASTTIYVCMTCRHPGDPEDASRPGAALAEATERAAAGTGVTVKWVRCLANCKRGLSAAIRRDGAWTYVFGDLAADSDAPALIEGARLLSGSADGLMPWRGRPAVLKKGLVARVPPIDFQEQTE
jgi:predicted metal-binding protein